MDKRLNMAARVGLAVLGLALALLILTARGPSLREGIAQLGALTKLAILVFAALLGFVLQRSGRTFSWLLRSIPAPLFGAIVVVAATSTSIVAQQHVHKSVPQVPDEFGYLHTAKTFAAGELTAPSPPLKDFYYVSWGVHDRGKWYAVFPPGYAVVLAVGVRVGAAWVVNPLLGAITALIIWRIGILIFRRDSAAARLACLLYLGSWSRLMLDGSFMSHTLAALLAATAVLFACTAVASEQPRRRTVFAALVGVTCALLVGTRQLDGVVVGCAIAVVFGFGLWRLRRQFLRPALAGALTFAIGLAGYLAYNHALTGDALLPPQQRYMQLKERDGDCFRLGFGPGVGQCPLTQETHFGKHGFQPQDAYKNTQLRLTALADYSFGWQPLVFLPILGLFYGAVSRGRRHLWFTALFATLVVGAIAAYGLFFFAGVTYGARFYYFAFPFLCLLSTFGLVGVRALAHRSAVGRTVVDSLELCLPILITLGVLGDEQAVMQHCGDRRYLKNGKLVEVFADPKLRDDLIFVDSLVVPAAFTPYPTDIARNHPLVVKDLGDRANAGLARLFPDRVPAKLSGDQIIPVTYDPGAPIHYNGGALYPIDRSFGGFADRVAARATPGVSLTDGAALRFRFTGAGGFRLPLLVLPADAGHMVVVVSLIACPHCAPVELSLDGHLLASSLPMDGAWRRVEHSFHVELTSGEHQLFISALRAKAGDLLVLDYIELQRDAQP